LRAAINWGMAQTPRPGEVSVPPIRRAAKQEGGDDPGPPHLSRRGNAAARYSAQADETEAHQYAGASLHDRIIGALELCCRRGEMLLIQNKRVNWDTHQIGIPGATAKDKENRRIPFNPKGRLAAGRFPQVSHP
jgi:hypothetical protein